VFTTGVVSTTDGGHPVALFFSGPQHAGENVKQVVQQRAAELPPPVLMGDASSRETSKLQAETEVLVANCLAHDRRHFADVLDNFPEECRHVLETLGRVYAFEGQARQQGQSPKGRLKFHQQNSGPVMKALRQWLDEQLKEKRTEPNSGLGKAMKYLLTHWNPLTLFLRHPGAPLDNSVCERALKKVVLHRKSALFLRTMNGAEVGDLFMSQIHICGLNQVNPLDYLTELQRHAAELRANPAAWMPWNYQEHSARPAPG